MATVDLGKVAVRPMGAWSSATTYEALDLVYLSGVGSFVALASSTNVTPGTDATKWTLMVADGHDGKTTVNSVINHTSSETTVTNLAWDTAHVFPEMSSFDFSLAATPSDGYEHELVVIFETPDDLTNFNLAVPSSISFGNGVSIADELAASTKYELRISSATMIAVYTFA